MGEPLTLAALGFYAGIECEACEENPASVTDVNGIHLCTSCAEGCRLPEFDA